MQDILIEAWNEREYAQRLKALRQLHKGKLLECPDGEHSPLGPSSAERWLNCPGSVAATANVPDPPSPYAISGTASHHLSDVCRKEGSKPRKYMGWKIAVIRKKGSGFSDVAVVDVDQARVDSVQTFIDYVNELPGRQMFEERVQYEIFVKRGFGTMDHASADDRVCHIVDFKDGSGHIVYAKDNSQLKLYATGWWLDFGWLYPAVDQFVLHIVQPRLDHDDKWEISRRDLLKWADEVVRPAALLTMMPGALFKAGPWCSANFCRIRRTCEVRQNSVLSEFLGEFDSLEEAAEIVEEIHQSIPTSSDARAAELLTLKDKVVSLFKDLKAHVFSRLSQGHECGDWKVVEGRSRRRWKFDDEAIAFVLTDEGLADDDIWVKKLITAPQAEQLLGKTNPIMKSHVRKPPGKPTLVSAEDPRRPMLLEDLKEFGNLDDEEMDDDN